MNNPIYLLSQYLFMDRKITNDFYTCLSTQFVSQTIVTLKKLNNLSQFYAGTH